MPVTIICEAIKESFENNYSSKPIVLRLRGLETEKGRKILEDLTASGQVFFEQEFDKAIQKTVDLA